MAISAGVEGTFRLGDVFSKSFGVFGRNVIAFVLIAALAYIPFFVLGLAMGSMAPSLRTAADPTAAVSIGLLTVLVWIICRIFANGAMTYGVVQDLRDGTVSIAQAIAIAARRFLPMIGVALSVTILSLLAYLLIAVPGAILFGSAGFLLMIPGFIVMAIIWCMFFVAAAVCVAEQAGVVRSLSRSRFLTKGHRWQIFGAAVLVFVAEVVVIAAVIGALLLAVGPSTPALVRVAYYMLSAGFAAFYAVLVAVFYYQLRVAKEGVDLAKIASVFD